MARSKGSANFAGSLEVLAGAPIDARSVVGLISDLTAAATFPYSYEGMVVYCKEDKKIYKLKGVDPTVSANWEVVGGGSEQVNADWDAESGVAEILNKPTLGTAAAKDSTNSVTQNSTDLVESGAVYTGLSGKVNKTSVGEANGVAELDANGKVPSSQLPAYVDEVVEGYYKAADDRFYEESTYETLITPESGKCWVDIAANKSYRWTGSVYVRVDEGVQIGETSDTAYRGDRGKTAYDFSQNPATATPSMNGTGAVGISGKWAREDHVHPSDTNKQDVIQVASLPTAGADYYGKVYQYIGATGNGLTHNYFYECVTDGSTYSWQQTNVQPNSGGSVGHTIEDNAGQEMTARSGLQFKGAMVTDDSTNDKTVVDVTGKSDISNLAAAFDATATYAVGDRVTYNGVLYRFTDAHTGAWDAGDVTAVNIDGEIPDALTSAQMDAIKGAFTPNMGAPLRAMSFSTNEQIVGTWIDGKPLYQRVFTGTSGSDGEDNTIGSLSNVDTLVALYGEATNVSGMKMGAPNAGIYFKYSSGNIQTYTVNSAGFANSACIIIAQYTKTTD